MITRRDFIATSAATASSPLVSGPAASDPGQQPLRAKNRVRRLHVEITPDGDLLLLSDGPETPPKLIRTEALERAFGKGTADVLCQPDHWRMIEEGWFSGDDLYALTDPDDPALAVWQATYRPEIEAHDLLCDLFRDRIQSPFGLRIPELGLTLGEHPCTPRYATAKLDHEMRLPFLAAEVSRRTDWLVIETDLLPSEERV